MKLLTLVLIVLAGTVFAYERFSVSGSVISDNIRGYEWIVGPDRDMTYYSAEIWVNSLGGDWRMPTTAELQILWYAGITLDNWGPFATSGWWVWSGDFSIYHSDGTFLSVSFANGGVSWADALTPYLGRAFAVRSIEIEDNDEPWTASDWTEVYGNDGGLNLSGEQVRYEGEVFEYTSHYWLVGPDRDMDWAEAKEWVDDLGDNWRMPYREELQGLWDAGISDDNWGPFENSGLWVWSGEIRSSRDAWAFYFSSLGEESVDRSNSINGRAFAVRPLYDRHTFRRNRLPTLEP